MKIKTDEQTATTKTHGAHMDAMHIAYNVYNFDKSDEVNIK